MPNLPKAYSRYLPTSQAALDWGLHVTDCGYTDIAPGSAYPPAEHPAQYRLDGENGRVLQEYQIVYIAHGKGMFRSGENPPCTVNAGTVFLLFPGIRHYYRPDPETGWHEFWIGFNGDQAHTLMCPPFFSPETPLFHIGLHQPLVELFMDICGMMQNEPFGYRHIIAAKTTEILARVHARSQGKSSLSPTSEKLVKEVCCHILEHAGESIDFELLARDLGTSYSSLRRIFKQHTGLAPNQYLLQLRIRNAETLLGTTNMPVQDIAEKTGFSSNYYFSRLFKEKTGRSPSDCRNQAQ